MNVALSAIEIGYNDVLASRVIDSIRDDSVGFDESESRENLHEALIHLVKQSRPEIDVTPFLGENSKSSEYARFMCNHILVDLTNEDALTKHMARIPDEYWNDIQVPLQELALVARKVDEYAKQHGEDESREYGFRLLWEARSSVETVLRCLVVVQAALKVNSAERQDRDRKRRFGITGLADDTFTHMTDASSVKKYHPELSTGNDFVTRQYFRVLRRHVWEALDERLLASKSARKQINWIRRKSVYVKRVWLDRIPGTNVTKAISERFDCEVRRIRSDLKIIREFEQAATISLFGMRLDRIKPKAMDLSGVFDDIMTWSVIEGELIEPQVLILRFAPDSNLPFLQRDRLAVIKDRFSNPAELLKRAKTKFQNRFNYEVNWRELDKWRKSKMPR